MSLANLLPGRVLLERYAVESVLGQGAMGIVCRGTDQRLRRPVAVKVLASVSTDPAARQRARARFHREAIAAARLRHPNVVCIHDFGTDAPLDLDVLVMELLEGRDLAVLLDQDGPPSQTTALDLISQAARGLGAGHQAGLVHRDVKPSNLSVSSAGGRPCLQVLDFGIVEISEAAGTLTQLTMIGSTPYTPRYASPEQLRCDRAITPSTDVYGLGLTAYELLTGERALDGPGIEERRKLPRRLEAQLIAHGTPAALVAVLVRAVGFDPGARFANADDFADALAVARVERPPGLTASRQDVPGERTGSTPNLPGLTSTVPARTRARVRPRTVSLGAAGVALVVAALMWPLLRGPATEPKQPLLPDPSLPPDTQVIIPRIRAEFQRIEQGAARINPLQAELQRGFPAAGTVAIYALDGSVRKAVVTRTGASDSQKVHEELYFRGDSLLFVYRRSRPLTGAGPSAEDRFYFDQGRLIRWQDREGRFVPLEGYEPSRQTAQLLQEAGAVITAFQNQRRASASPVASGGAMEGRRDSLYRVGRVLYDQGKAAKALPSLRLAADEGLATAQFSLGRIYQFGLGVSLDSAEAIRWSRMALAKGDQ